MRNFVQDGNVVTVVAPAGGVLSGDGLLIGSLFGVCAFDALAGNEVELATVGVFVLPKATGALAIGDLVFWDNTAKRTTATAAGNRLIGVATAASVAEAINAGVRLNGTAALVTAA
jgi:predicted RecA/RadA family phage recombinase